MTIARVVPLRRFDIEHDWFDYALPDGLEIQPGHLVEISFRRTVLPGVVWQLATQSSERALKPIIRLLRPEPVMSQWQMNLVELFAVQGIVSLGHLVQSIIPTFPKRNSKGTPTLATGLVTSPVQSTLPRTDWYTQRELSIQEAAAWLIKPSKRPRIILVPTIADGEEIQKIVRVTAQDVAFVTSQLTPARYRQAYEEIRLGQVAKVIGTTRALTLPYPTAPDIYLDQEEHPAHKQQQQHPRLDPRPLLPHVAASTTVSTPAPSLSWWRQYHPSPPAMLPSHRFLWSLNRNLQLPWMSDELLAAIDAVRQNHTQAWLIVPQHGYASAMVCIDCGQPLACPRCGQQAAIFQTDSLTGRCRHCRQTVSVTLQCPKCGGSHWRFRGLGPERCLEMIHQRWPDLRLSGQETAPSEVDILVGTYQDWRRAANVPRLQLVCLMAGDALRNWPDFSADERAWQYLWRVAAILPANATFAIQTYNPDNDFWQRWRRADHAHWYEAELSQRRKLQLPPFRQQWIAALPGPSAKSLAEETLQQIQALSLPGISAELLPGSQTNQTAKTRLLISATADVPLRQRLPWRQLFPYPWQVDTTINSWLT